MTGVLTQLGGVLLATETVDTALKLVTRLASMAVPGSSGAGVTLIDDRGKRSVASSDAWVEQADALQYELDSGPCITAWRDRVLVRIDDVAHDPRWSEWTAAVEPLGVGSVLSVPLVAGQESMGAVKVYARHPRAYDAHAEELLQLFAQQAAILLANTQTVAEARRVAARLSEGLQSRDVIEQAKGILLARGAGDDQGAFAILAAASQRSKTTLHDVARALIISTTSGDDL